ncbi:MAG TPA: glycosyltransferase family 4 protein [Chitinivibrionales bacterium]|nr:glycosyltransferase family 4 protein [Chitinivibrionales bacterium]
MKKPKHILMIVENNTLPYDRRVWHEALAARELGYRVSAICPYDKKIQNQEHVIEGIRIYRHPNIEGSGIAGLLLEYANSLVWEMLLAFRIFLTDRFDVVHVANPPDHLFLVFLPYKIFGVKFIFDHHDITPENFEAKFGRKGFFVKALFLMERISFLCADLVISTNQSYKQIALDRGKRNEKDIIVVRNGPDADIMRSVRPNGDLRNGFRYLVGYVGVIGQQEGIENLLAAADHIVRKVNRTDIKFIVVGTGPHWRSVVKLCGEMGIDRYVQFTGYISDHDLYEILSSVDVCVNPEFDNEFTDKSTMIKIMEYMTFGKPIVQFYTKEGEVTAGESACYVRENSPVLFAEALLELLDDGERRATMGKIGQDRIDTDLGWPRQKLNLKIAYERVLGPRVP